MALPAVRCRAASVQWSFFSENICLPLPKNTNTSVNQNRKVAISSHSPYKLCVMLLSVLCVSKGTRGELDFLPYFRGPSSSEAPRLQSPPPPPPPHCPWLQWHVCSTSLSFLTSIKTETFQSYSGFVLARLQRIVSIEFWAVPFSGQNINECLVTAALLTSGHGVSPGGSDCEKEDLDLWNQQVEQEL